MAWAGPGAPGFTHDLRPVAGKRLASDPVTFARRDREDYLCREPCLELCRIRTSPFDKIRDKALDEVCVAGETRDTGRTSE